MSGIRRYPVLSYFLLAFLISWAGILLVTVPSGFPRRQEDMRIFLLVFASMGAGPSISGIVMTGVMEGKAGLRGLLARGTRWQVRLRWYALALLTAPALLAAVFWLLSLASPAFAPAIVTTENKGAVLAFALAGGLAAGFFEEIGWTGFATPRMLHRKSLPAMSLMLGFIWSVWHMLPDVWAWASFFGSLLIPRMLLWTVAMMTPYRLLMTWVYTHTRSVLVAMLMHAGFTGGQALLNPTALSPVQNLLWYAIFASTLWVLAAVVIVRGRRSRSGEEPEPVERAA